MASTTAATESGAPHPPPIGPQGGRAWVRRLEPFVGRAGWFQVEGEYAKSVVAQLNKAARTEKPGTYVYRLPPGRWEFTSRRTEVEGRVTIWAQWLGPDTSDAA